MLESIEWRSFSAMAPARPLAPRARLGAPDARGGHRTATAREHSRGKGDHIAAPVAAKAPGPIVVAIDHKRWRAVVVTIQGTRRLGHLPDPAGASTPLPARRCRTARSTTPPSPHRREHANLHPDLARMVAGIAKTGRQAQSLPAQQFYRPMPRPGTRQLGAKPDRWRGRGRASGRSRSRPEDPESGSLVAPGGRSAHCRQRDREMPGRPRSWYTDHESTSEKQPHRIHPPVGLRCSGNIGRRRGVVTISPSRYRYMARRENRHCRPQLQCRDRQGILAPSRRPGRRSRSRTATSYSSRVRVFTEVKGERSPSVIALLYGAVHVADHERQVATATGLMLQWMALHD